jgi:hypothetical protein
VNVEVVGAAVVLLNRGIKQHSNHETLLDPSWCSTQRATSSHRVRGMGLNSQGTEHDLGYSPAEHTRANDEYSLR